MTVDLRSMIASYAKHEQLPTDAELKDLIRICRRGSASAESTLLEIKAGFADTSEAWLTLEKQLVAFSNSGGGILAYGIPDRPGESIGLPKSLVKSFDPATINPKLQRHAPTIEIPTSYTEINHYGKLYGFLFVGTNRQISVFDKIGNKPRADGKGQESVFRPGVIYVRNQGRSVEARQSDLDRLVGAVVSDGLTSFLARIERVAALPTDSELLVRQPGQDRAYILVSAGQGVPVDLSASGDSNAVALTEVLTPDLPMSSLDAEIVAQLRQWRTDKRHRVGKSALARWYLGRGQLTTIADAAEFCLRSAVHDHGFSMFWASHVPRERLAKLVTEEFTTAYPAWQSVPYLIGTFFFDRRAELIRSCAPPLVDSMTGIVDRLLKAETQEEYLRCAKGTSAVLKLEGTNYDLDSLSLDQEIAQSVFSMLMEREDQGQLPSSTMRQIAHRLDMTLHCDPDSTPAKSPSP